jgi:REP element-mobilizing transposase RayT
MRRLPRICPIGIAQHIIQRGNIRQICFGSEQDFFAYVGWLKEFSVKCKVDIHAWVLMTNHAHLWCTPHCLYTALGINDNERQATYRCLFTSHVEGELLKEMRAATQSGMASGNGRFKSELTSLTGRHLHTLPPSRKLGWRKS